MGNSSILTDHVPDISNDVTPSPNINIQYVPRSPDLFESLPIPDTPDDTPPVKTTRAGHVIKAPHKFTFIISDLTLSERSLPWITYPQKNKLRISLQSLSQIINFVS